MKRIKLEPLALLLTLIAICMSVLCLLSFATSLADERLAKRYAETVKIRYELEEEGQRYLADLNLDEYNTDIIEKEIIKDDYVLNIVLEKTQDSYQLKQYKIEKIWENYTGIKDLWKGE